MNSVIHELAKAVRARRTDIGLTQSALAKLSGLSRATVNQLESGLINDLSLSRTERLLSSIGLSMQVAGSGQRNPKTMRKTPALDLASQTASVSYRTPLSTRQLKQSLMTGHVPLEFQPHMHALLDEASVPLLAAVVEQVYEESSVEHQVTWTRMRCLAVDLKSKRELWN